VVYETTFKLNGSQLCGNNQNVYFYFGLRLFPTFDRNHPFCKIKNQACPKTISRHSPNHEISNFNQI